MVYIGNSLIDVFLCVCVLCRTSVKKQGKKFKVVFVPVKTMHCVKRFSVSPNTQPCCGYNYKLGSV